jgi:hypothetical protein
VTSLKAVTARSSSAVLGVALLLSACGGEPPPDATRQPSPAPLAAPPGTAPAPLAGLTPLPSADQVVASVSSGRVDPFAPLPIEGTSARPVPLKLPPGLVFNGVIRSSGTPEALVQFGGETGTLRVGQRGGRSTSLLPAGWSVASIDVQKGRLTLRQGKQTVSAEL